MTTVLIPIPPERSHPSRRRGAVVAENRTPRGRVRTRPSPPSGRPKLGQQGRGGNPYAPACLAAHLLILLTCFAYFAFAHLGAQATTTLTATPCRWGRNVARPSSSKTKVPPGLMA